MGIDQMIQKSGSYQEIINKLERKTRKEYLLLASIGALITILLSVAVYFNFAFLESVFHFSSPVRSWMFFLFIVIAIGAAASTIIFPLLKYFRFFRRTDYFSTAQEIGTYYPLLKDDLVNAMQLVEGRGSYFYSSVLIDAAFEKVYEKSRSLHFDEIVDFRKLRKLFLYTVIPALFMILLLLFVPSLNAAAVRLNNFDKEFTAPPAFTLTVYPGDASITKGDNFEIKVTAAGKVPEEISIAVKSDEQTDYKLENIIPDSAGVFQFKINSVRTSLSYFAASGDIRSTEFRVEVTDKPLIKNFELTIKPPAYSGLPEVVQKDNGNISALNGSSVSIKLSSNKELSQAYINFDDSVKNNLRINYQSALGEFRVRRDETYKIFLVDQSNNGNDAPITYSIKALSDAYPFIEMIEPEGDVNLSNDNRVPFQLKISDDFGFSKLVINYRITGSDNQDDFKSVEIPIDKNKKEADVAHIWNLSSLSLGTNDVVNFYLEVFDNDRVTGPKSSKTSSYNIRIPSLQELLAMADKKQNKVSKDLENTLKESEELKKTLTKIDNDLKQDKKELSWQEKEKLQDALDKFEQLQEKMKESGKDLSEMQKDMQKNDLLSKETLDKYMQLQKLFDELSGEEYKKAMEKFREQLQNMDRKAAQDALENMKLNEENFRKSIERTLSLLKRVKIEQKMNEMVKRSEEMNKNLEDMMKNESENSSKKQENMTDQLKKMEEDLEKLKKDMEGMEDMPEKELGDLSEEFEKQQNEELSKQASEDMKQNKMQQAKQKQSQLSKNMQNFSKQMQQLQQQMMEQNQMEAFADMMRMLENLITLSRQQEELKKETQQSYENSNSDNNAERQSKLQRSLDNLMKELGEMSQKTFAVTPEMGKALGDAKREMMKALQAMQSRNGSYAANSQGEAMKSLNEAAMMMQGSMESMMQGGGKGGMMSLMQQMGQMAQQQMGLNNLTQKLQQGNQGQLTPSEQAELQRLQQQQGMIKKSMEELNREAKRTGESKKIPASLESMVKEMQEIISDMDTQRLDDRLIQKQERILSRMLDAQRSLNERDFEKERESNTGENITRESPSELNLNSSKGKERIKDELSRAVNEGYKKDYESLIRRYFELLEKENNAERPSGN
jgi:hypothetical protein